VFGCAYGAAVGVTLKPLADRDKNRWPRLVVRLTLALCLASPVEFLFG
jgi:hypothetical protein